MKSKPFSHTLLIALAVSGIVLIAATNPFFGLKAIGAIQKEFKRKKWKRFQDDLYYLRRRGFVEVDQNSDGSYSVRTTASGRHQAEKYNLDNISIKVPKKWDKHWWLVIFDIPTNKQKGRLVWLSKLKELGFIMIQKSVWAHPFECGNEIAVLARAFEVDRYVQHLTCNKISAGEYLQEEFEKKNNIKLG